MAPPVLRFFSVVVLTLALGLVAAAVVVPVTRRFVYEEGTGCTAAAPYYVSLRNEGSSCAATLCGVGLFNGTRANVDCLHTLAFGLGKETGTANQPYVVVTTGNNAADCSDEAPFGGAITATNRCVQLEPDGGRGVPLYARAYCTAGQPTLYLCHNDPTCRECILFRGTGCQDFSAHTPGFGTMTCTI
jgi:hypothetical protein